MGIEWLEFPSPALGALAGTDIHYQIERRLKLDFAILELGRYHWDRPVELVVRNEDNFYAFNLAISPRPRSGKITPPGHVDGGDLESISRVLLTPPGSAFRMRLPSGHIRSLYFGIDRLKFEDRFGSQESHGDIPSRLDMQTVELLLNRMYEELRDDRFASGQAIEAYASALCVELARALRAADEKPRNDRRGGLTPGRMRLVMDRIQAEAPAPNLHELAELCGLTVRQLSRAFKQETGRTLGKYIDQVVIERASRMLIESDLTIAEVAAALGFLTPSSFSFAFRRATGLAPGELRRRGG